MSTANPMEATNPALEEDPEAILQEISDLLSALRNNEKRWRDRCEMLENLVVRQCRVGNGRQQSRGCASGARILGQFYCFVGTQRADPCQYGRPPAA